MYEAVAPFYDDFAGSAQDRAEKVLSTIREHAPGASSLVEFGCGSGLVLKEMPSAFDLAGIDLSASLLARAAQRCPGAHLVQADICDVAVGRRFDVVTCIFDTLNHVSDVTRWSEVFATAARHLTAGGLFIFDVNTQSRLQRLGDAPPWVAPIEAGTLIMKVNAEADTDTFLWDIRVFEDLGDSLYRLHHDKIRETAAPLSDIVVLLDPLFEVLQLVDDAMAPATDDSDRAHFVCRLK